MAKKKETTEKYLAQMLEGYEQNLPQLDQALEQLKMQLRQMEEQRESMLDGITELKGLLGLKDETETPHLALVKE